MNYELIETGGGYIVKLGNGMYLNSYHETGNKKTAKVFATKDHALTSIGIWVRGQCINRSHILPILCQTVKSLDTGISKCMGTTNTRTSLVLGVSSV